MKHLLALVLKFAVIAIILEVVLRYLTNISAVNILWIALAVTVIAYLIGDMVILDKTNNTVATISDAVLAFLTIYAFNWIYPDARITVSTALLAALALAVGEWIFHKYIRSAVFPPVEKA